MDNKVILQRLGIILAFPLAYAYVRLILSASFGEFTIDPSQGAGPFLIAFSYPLFALMFIIVNELVRRGRRGTNELSKE